MAFISRYYPIFIATLLMFCTGISPVVNADDVLKRMAVGYQVPSLDGSALGELFGLQRGSLTFQIARVGNTTAAEDSTEDAEGVVIEGVKQGQVTDR